MTATMTLRVPTGIVSNKDGLNEATRYVEVPVIIDPTMTRRGEVRRGFSGQVIALREWDEQVLLHEALHVALGWVQPPLSPEQEHPVVCQVEVALWEMGWRLRDAEARRVVAVDCARCGKESSAVGHPSSLPVCEGCSYQLGHDAALAEIEEGSP